MTDAEIYACWQKHDRKRQAQRRVSEGSAVEDAAAELDMPCSRVRDVVFAREFNWFAG